MSFRGDDERRVKMKHDGPREKQPSHRGRGIAGSSRGTVGSSEDAKGRGSRDEQIQ